MTDPPTPVVLRLATITWDRGSRVPELRRLFSEGVRVETLTGLRTAAAVAAAVEELGAVAVLADVYRTSALEELRQALAPVPVLRPILEPRPGVHAGGREHVFARYGRLGPDGKIIELADGELT